MDSKRHLRVARGVVRLGRRGIRLGREFGFVLGDGWGLAMRGGLRLDLGLGVRDRTGQSRWLGWSARERRRQSGRTMSRISKASPICFSEASASPGFLGAFLGPLVAFKTFRCARSRLRRRFGEGRGVIVRRDQVEIFRVRKGVGLIVGGRFVGNRRG